MPLVATEAVVLHAIPYLESSRILRLATRAHGVVSVLGKGARKSQRRFGSAVDLFAEGDAQYYTKPGRDLHTLGGFEVTRARVAIGADLDRFASASALAELVLRFGRDETDPSWYDALVDALDGIAAAPPAHAREAGLAGAWGIVGALGFAPALDHCAHCAADLPLDADVRFSQPAGGTLCDTCARLAGPSRALPAAARASVRAWLDHGERRGGGARNAPGSTTRRCGPTSGSCASSCANTSPTAARSAPSRRGRGRGGPVARPRRRPLRPPPTLRPRASDGPSERQPAVRSAPRRGHGRGVAATSLPRRRTASPFPAESGSDPGHLRCPVATQSSGRARDVRRRPTEPVARRSGLGAPPPPADPSPDFPPDDQRRSADRKIGEALNEAVSLARRAGNPLVYDLHLLLALLAQDEGIVSPLLQKLGVNVADFRQRAEREAARYPKQSDAQPTLSRELNQVTDRADTEARQLGDEYVSTEHLLLALSDTKGTESYGLLRAVGAGRDQLLEALRAVRGTHKVTDQNPRRSTRRCSASRPTSPSARAAASSTR
jgi:DNA repair protein RecO